MRRCNCRCRSNPRWRSPRDEACRVDVPGRAGGCCLRGGTRDKLCSVRGAAGRCAGNGRSPEPVCRFLRTHQGSADLPGDGHDAGRFLHGLERANELGTALQHALRHLAGGVRCGCAQRVARTPHRRHDAAHAQSSVACWPPQPGCGVTDRLRADRGWAGVSVLPGKPPRRGSGRSNDGDLPLRVHPAQAPYDA